MPYPATRCAQALAQQVAEPRFWLTTEDSSSPASSPLGLSPQKKKCPVLSLILYMNLYIVISNQGFWVQPIKNKTSLMQEIGQAFLKSDL